MKIIDLTQTIYEGMPVFPGDPAVKIEKVQTIDIEGWDLQTLLLSSHLGTHVNMPSHMIKDGKTLDNFSIDKFCGKAVIFNGKLIIDNGKWTGEPKGVIFREQNIDDRLANLIIERKPLFVGLAENHEFDIEIEKKLLEHEIISFENLANCEQLPDEFTFYGLPLKIKEGNGSPVRAIAIIE